jgi:G3E family GTPase
VLAGIPVNLITGRDARTKSRLLAQILRMRPAGSRWAVLVNEDGVVPDADARDGVIFSEVAQGCICCTAQLPLRVGLTRLLRETEPGRLFIQASGRARSGEILRLLSDRWLAPVLSLRATVHVLGVADFPALLDDETHADQLGAAQVVVVDDGGAGNAAREALAQHLSALKSAPRIICLGEGVPDQAWLDLPGLPVTPYFRAD